MNILRGTTRLTALAVRRDRFFLPFWLVIPAVVTSGLVAAFKTAFPTAEALRQYAETSINNFVFTVGYGRLYGSTLGEMITWRAGFVPVIVAIVSLLLVIRHTRTEEESGRRELIGSTAVSRHAGLAAALLMTGVATVILGALAALALIGNGLAVAGSVAYGLRLIAVGWTFAAIGAVVAQLTTGSGAARMIGYIIIGLAFLLRGVGDVSARGDGSLAWLSWLSPLSWAGQIRPFSGNRWWVLLIPLFAVVVLVMLAVALSQRRDIGAGLLAGRDGRATAPSNLSTPFGLAWRLNRGSIVGWIGLCIVLGAPLGGIAQSIGDLLGSSSAAAQEAIGRLGGAGTLIDQYFWSMCRLFALAGCAYVIQRVLWLRAEESSGRAEYLLAAPVKRLSWAAGNFVLTLVGTSVGLLLFGVAAGLTHGIGTGNIGGEVPRIVGAILVTLPAIWVFAGLAFAFFGWLPRLVAGTFAIFAASMLIAWFGEELQLSQWVVDMSLFSHVPVLPGGVMRVEPLLVMSIIAVVLIGIGALGVRQRDLPIP